jgi:putative integral membrane protein (TIGR02587 family)
LASSLRRGHAAIKQWSDELTAFTRAFAGAAIFGIPLIFTMEMWWIGKTLPLIHLMAVLSTGFVANLGLSYVAGFRTRHSLTMSLDQAIDALAVGIVGATMLLVTLNQLRVTDGVGQGVGMVMLLAVPLSLGASVARYVFSGRTSRQGDESSPHSSWQGVLSDVGATAIGGVFIGITIAPTDEVKMIAAGLSSWHLFAIVGLSLFLSYLIVFASGFDEASPPGPFQHPATETMLAYTISLAVAFGMLMLFERITPGDPLHEMINQTIVLALPAAIGGAAGRLVV